MHMKKVGTKDQKIKTTTSPASHPRPAWVKASVTAEEELCPECFRVVGVESRYKLVCLLGSAPEGMTVSALTAELKLRQPTVTHHLNVLRSVDAVADEAQL